MGRCYGAAKGEQDQGIADTVMLGSGIEIYTYLDARSFLGLRGIMMVA